MAPANIDAKNSNKEDKEVKKRVVLTEEDVPGASFKNKDPQVFHNEQHKRWLKCRGASVGGNGR